MCIINIVDIDGLENVKLLIGEHLLLALFKVNNEIRIIKA